MSRVHLAVVTLLFAAPTLGVAKPAHKQALAAHLGPFFPERVNDCRLCHAPGEIPAGEDKPRNTLGERLEEVRGERKQAGRPIDIPSRFDAIADEDADGDGVSNLIEVLTGHWPGDAADAPTPAELTAATKTLARYQRFRTSYPWRPFEPVVRPPVPEARDPAWAANPVDRFLAAARDAEGFPARPEADRATLLRRVTLDLTGLPPTPGELAAFVADMSPSAYERAVDRLLASPRYGERWGRHWMDVWRYSDWAGWTGGNEVRDSQPHVWRWRDWIVESLNADKPYDRMVLEMLAGDEVAPDDPAVIRATGYLARNYKADREVWLQEVVDHTFLAFQAVTIKCARCHDHFFDPLKQSEYYQVRAVFTPHKVRLDRVPGHPDVSKDGLARAFDADPAAPTYLLERGDERHPDTSAALPPGVPAAYGPRFPEVRPVRLPPGAIAPDAREFVVRDELIAADAAVAAARTALDGVKPGETPVAEAEVELAVAKRSALAATIAADRLAFSGRMGTPDWEAAAKAAFAAQRAVDVAAGKRDVAATRGDAKKLVGAKAALAKAEARAAETPATGYTPRPVATYSAESTGRRTALAKWLTDPANPLTARVAVNHVWLRHFGQALVPSVFDFGKNGRLPVHPALVDWLAAEFKAGGWRMKPLHRLIVTSRAYRAASTPDPNALARDRDNDYYWRFAPRRLEAEAVRDQLLAVAGRLDLSMGGPDLDHTRALDLPRRSVYFRHAHEKQAEFLATFDAAGVTECYQRRESIVPQQALALANSPLSVRMARDVAGQLAAAAGADPGAFAEAAYRRVLGRPPTPAERAECETFLGEAGLPPGPGRDLVPAHPDSTDTVAYEIGTEFRATEDAVVTALRYYRAPSEAGGHMLRLWDADGRRLAEAMAPDRPGGGWRTVPLDPPVSLAKGGRYVVSVNYHRHYPYTKESALGLRANSPVAFERGRFGPVGGFPTRTYGLGYFVDVQASPANGPNAEAVSLFTTSGRPTGADRRRELLVLALFNHHEFVTLR